MVCILLLLNTAFVSLQLLSMDNTSTFNFKKFFEEKDHGGKTYLHRTIKAGNTDMWHNYDLFDEPLDATYLTNIKTTNPILLESIIAHKVDVNIQDAKGRTPLYYAAKYKNEPATKLLLQAGADPNIKDKNSLSPLIIACSIENNAPIITTLLTHNADTKDLFGPTPDLFVKDHENEKTIETALKTCPVNAAALMQFFKNKKTIVSNRKENRQPRTLELLKALAKDYAALLWCAALIGSLY